MFKSLAILFPALVLSLGVCFAEADSPIRARLVTHSGKVVGSRTIRDTALCGKDMGPTAIAEGGLVSENMHLECVTAERFETEIQAWPGSEVRTIVQQGPTDNRIDLVIIGDGYTEQEKGKFFSDAELIVEDLFNRDTFATYRPLFNVHVVFVPSQVSGIGDGAPIRTALGLYRHPTVRQAVIPGNESAANRAAALAPDVDFPILVGNDRFYGGLGGAFAITTAAPLNLTTVLRHELGHNFGQVGEEYDGGQVYRGGNFSSSLNVSWKHWIEGAYDRQTAQILYYSAPWVNLSAGPWLRQFDMPQGMSRLLVDFSSLGFDTRGDVKLLIDGVEVPYDGSFNYDRNFYLVEKRVSSGRHAISFQENVNDRNNIVSKVGLYALPENYPLRAPEPGAFTTYNESHTAVGYRPTDRDCLMRDMHSQHFCSPCVETMWRNFLGQVSLIDGTSFDGTSVKVAAIPLSGRLQVRWTNPQGVVRADLNDLLEWAPAATDRGTWNVTVRLVSPEIRVPQNESWTTFRKSVVVR